MWNAHLHPWEEEEMVGRWGPLLLLVVMGLCLPGWWVQGREAQAHHRQGDPHPGGCLLMQVLGVASP